MTTTGEGGRGRAMRGTGREIDAMLASSGAARGAAPARRRAGRFSGAFSPGGRRLNFVRAAGLAAIVMLIVAVAGPARAVDAVNVRTDASAIDLTAAVERHRTDADRILVSTAPGADGIVQRMDVRAREGNNTWAVFALANSGNEQIDRLIVVPHYRLVGSGLFWPDLGLSRVVTITSSGERPDRQG